MVSAGRFIFIGLLSGWIGCFLEAVFAIFRGAVKSPSLGADVLQTMSSVVPIVGSLWLMWHLIRQSWPEDISRHHHQSPALRRVLTRNSAQPKLRSVAPCRHRFRDSIPIEFRLKVDCMTPEVETLLASALEYKTTDSNRLYQKAYKAVDAIGDLGEKKKHHAAAIQALRNVIDKGAHPLPGMAAGTSCGRRDQRGQGLGSLLPRASARRAARPTTACSCF